MISRTDLLIKLNQLLTPERFQDYCPNGLQIEGEAQIDKIITGVSLSNALIDVAIAVNAKAIIVHHGIFWHKEDYALTGIKKNRVAKLMAHGINLYAYHLPLDNHTELGNNVQLAQVLGINSQGNTDTQGLLWYGELAKPCSMNVFVELIRQQLKRQPSYFSNDIQQTIQRIAWCTGGADNLFAAAINLGVDAYISGEVSEPIMSMAHESGVTYIAAGHYATERYGIMALTDYIVENWQLDCNYIELYNPV